MKEKKTVTLHEMNKRPGQIIREVHFSKEPVTVTANGKPAVQIIPAASNKAQRRNIAHEQNNQ